jgi:hypothetical protein
MSTLPAKTDERVEGVYFTRDSIVVDLMDGRTISAPLAWYPRLLKATLQEKNHWEICGGGYGIHWPDIDEDLSVAGLLRGSPAPSLSQVRIIKKAIRPTARRSVKRPNSTTKRRKAKKLI